MRAETIKTDNPTFEPAETDLAVIIPFPTPSQTSRAAELHTEAEALLSSPVLPAPTEWDKIAAEDAPVARELLRFTAELVEEGVEAREAALRAGAWMLARLRQV